MDTVISQARAAHLVHKSMNKALTIWGAERRLFFVALVVGAVTFNFFASLTAGITMFIALYLFARWATVYDAQILRILLNSAKFKAQYDAGKRSASARSLG